MADTIKHIQRCAGCGDEAVVTCFHCHAPICARECAVFSNACPVCGKPWMDSKATIVVMATCDECGESFEVTHECA